jgi:hypothetical protein
VVGGVTQLGAALAKARAELDAKVASAAARRRMQDQDWQAAQKLTEVLAATLGPSRLR